MDYVKIPQNIRVEDKIVGPLSLRQIFLIAIGGGISYTMYAMVQKTLGSVPAFAHVIIWWPAIIIISLAVVRINDISLTRYVLLIIEGFMKPKIRLWQPRKGVSSLPAKFTAKKTKKSKKGEQKIEKLNKTDVRIEELSVILDKEAEKEKEVSAVSFL